MSLVTPLAQTHVGLYVSDLDLSAAYLSRVLGFEAKYDSGPGAPNRIIIGLVAGLAVELVSRPEGLVALPVDADGMGIANLSLSVADVDEAYAALKAEGLANLRAPATSSSGVRLLLFRDPDDNLIELIELGEARTVAEMLG